MKKVLFALGLTAAACSFLPGSASAHAAYDPSDDENSSAPQAQADDNQGWDQGRCERLGYRLSNLNAAFDQENDHRLWREQRVIDRQNDNGCAASGTIVDALVQNGNFTTLVAAVQAAGLGDALSAAGDKTVFAPTDQAFAALPAGTVDALLQDIPMLTTILTNHVVAGKVDAVTAMTLSSATALNGNTLRVSVQDGDLYINNAKVLLHDINTTNGVVHVIDTVLVP